ncbi:MAG: hypothetical protein J7L62_00955 [Candidatus Aminicenantes bacterium]|nr:hypothetical protein [Candidatus Aminicenantes bacterium]
MTDEEELFYGRFKPKRPQRLHRIAKIMEEFDSEFVFAIDNEGIHTQTLDSAHVMMLHYTMPETTFSDFELKAERRILLEVNPTTLWNIFRYAKHIEGIEVKCEGELHEEEKFKGVLYITLHGVWTETYKIFVDTQYYEELHEPHLNYKGRVKINASLLKQALKKVRGVSSKAILQITEEDFIILPTTAGQGILGELKLGKEHCNIHITEQCKSKFSAGYFWDILHHFTARDPYKEIEIWLGDDIPTKLSMKSDQDTMDILIAPMIETEE